jgi:Ca-activated chloride channel family protein
VGDDVNAVLLDRLALENRGRSTFLRPDKDIQETLQAFYDRVSHPVLRDLTLEVEGVGAYSLLPSPPPDLFRGDQLVVLGRYREAGQGTVTVTGLMGKQQRRYSLKVAFPAQAAQHAFVPTLWAQRQVALLLDRLRQDGENPALLKELVQLATKYGIVTPYTSYLVTVPGETMPPDSPEPPPHLVPMPGHRPPIPRLEIISEASVGTVAASPQMAQRAADHAAFKATTGASAVRSSQDLARLREADTVKAVEGTAPVSIGARAFELEGGAWVQREARGWKGPRVLLRTLGPAALALASSDPDLARVLALGQRVVFVLGKTLVEISPEAPDTDEAREQKLLGL